MMVSFTIVMVVACVSALLFYVCLLCYNHANSKPSAPLSTAESASDYLGCYLLVLQQDQAELGLSLCKVQASCVSRNDLALYTCTVSIKGREGDRSTPQPNLPKVVP